MTGALDTVGKRSPRGPRSLPIAEWPEADRSAWEDACRPGRRLKPGGAASYLAPVSRQDFARRYGAFLGFLQRDGRLSREVAAAAQVTVPNVEAYIADLTGPGPFGDGLQLHLQAASGRRAACPNRRLLLARRDREGSRACHGAPVEIRTPGVHGPTGGGRADVGGRSAALCKGRSCPRPWYPQRTHGRAARPLSNSAEELCGLGDRAARSKRFMAGGGSSCPRHHQNSPGRRASRPRTAEPHHRCLPQRITAHPYRISISTRTALWISSTTGRPMTAKNLGILISKLTLKP